MTSPLAMVKGSWRGRVAGVRARALEILWSFQAPDLEQMTLTLLNPKVLLCKMGVEAILVRVLVCMR